MAEFVTFTRKLPKEKYDGPDGLKALIVEVLNYPTEIDTQDENGKITKVPNPISEDQFVKICIIENDKKFFKDLSNIQRTRRTAIAGANDFELT